MNKIIKGFEKAGGDSRDFEKGISEGFKKLVLGYYFLIFASKGGYNPWEALDLQLEEKGITIHWKMIMEIVRLYKILMII